MSKQDWEAIAKERLDAIVRFKTRAEAAEARVKVLEEALRKIERYCKAALAAKEKP